MMGATKTRHGANPTAVWPMRPDAAASAMPPDTLPSHFTRKMPALGLFAPDQVRPPAGLLPRVLLLLLLLPLLRLLRILLLLLLLRLRLRLRLHLRLLLQLMLLILVLPLPLLLLPRLPHHLLGLLLPLLLPLPLLLMTPAAAGRAVLSWSSSAHRPTPISTLAHRSLAPPRHSRRRRAWAPAGPACEMSWRT